MENAKFDCLTKSVVFATSRRQALRGLAASFVAAVLGRAGLETAAAQLSADDCVGFGEPCRKQKGEPKPRCCARLRCRNNRCRCANDDRECRGKCITRRQCCENDECPGNLRCRQNRCVCGQGQQFCNGECIPQADNCPIRVTPSNLKGWLLQGEDAFSQDPSLTTFVEGPGNPPIGDGSIRLNPEAFGSFAEGQTQAVLRTLQFEGTSIGEIDTLGYSIYVPTTENGTDPEPGDPPTMQLAVVNVNNTSNFASLIFIPGANGNVPPAFDTWTDYTPTSQGFFASTRDVLGPNDECLICRSIGSTPHEGDCTNPVTCATVENVTWAQVQSAMPAATLNNSGSFSFRIGRGDTGTGFLTNVRFNDDRFFFEPDDDDDGNAV